MADTTLLTLVFATFTFEGVHHWENAPKEVEYLRNLHRHIFYVKVVKEVQHDDRDVEFIMFGHEVRAWIQNNYPKYSQSDRDGTVDLEYASCEMIAKALFDAFNLYSCEVSEDGENGAIIIKQ